jgi:hypothetical protein
MPLPARLVPPPLAAPRVAVSAPRPRPIGPATPRPGGLAPARSRPGGPAPLRPCAPAAPARAPAWPRVPPVRAACSRARDYSYATFNFQFNPFFFILV